jgi:hypothetical protein
LLPILKPKMDFSDMFYDLPNEVPVAECNCRAQVRLALLIATAIVVMVDCITSCRTNRKMNALETENTTLKEIVRKSVDRTITQILKNGYHADPEDED